MPTTHRLIHLESLSLSTWLVHPANAPQERLLLRWTPCPQTVVPIHSNLGCWISQGLVDSKVASIERISAVHSLQECMPPEHVQGNIYWQIKDILKFLHKFEISHGKIEPNEIWFKLDGSVMLSGTALIEGTFEQDHIQLQNLWDDLKLSKIKSDSQEQWLPKMSRAPQMEFLYEWLSKAPRHDIDLPLIQEYSESTAPQLLVFEDNSEEPSQTA